MTFPPTPPRGVAYALQKASVAAWRAVLHPAELPDLGSPDRRATAPWTEAWLDATGRWIEALADAPRALLAGEDRLVTDTVQGLARRFRGRRVALWYGGRRIRAVLESIELECRHDRPGGWLRLSDVEWDGMEFEELSIAVEGLTLSGTPNVTLTASGVTLGGQTTLVSLVTWLDRHLPQWQLGVTGDGPVEAVRNTGGKRFLVELAVFDGELEVELRGVRWRGVRVRCPDWLRFTRKLPLPSLPEGMSVREARRRGTSVDLRLWVPEVSRRLPGLDDRVLGSSVGRPTR